MTFKQILDSLKITAEKILKGIKPEDALPVYSRDFNALIEALKTKEDFIAVPTSTADIIGEEGDITYDNTYLYIKTASGWGRIELDFLF